MNPELDSSESPSLSAIWIRGLLKIYPSSQGEIKAIDGLNLQITKGELYGLLGPNGAGKSTAINILCGLNSATSGKVFVNGLELQKNLSTIKKQIGVCPQEPSVFPYLSGRQNIEFLGDLHTVPKQTLKARTQELLEKIGLMHDADRQVKTYSGGMLRRINVAMALINDPEIVFLDEPTVAMDPQARHGVWDFIRDLKARHKTVILTTHYIEEAEALCDRVGIIDHGKLIAEGTPAQLKSQYGAKTLEDVFIQITGRMIREGGQ